MRLLAAPNCHSGPQQCTGSTDKKVEGINKFQGPCTSRTQAAGKPLLDSMCGFAMQVGWHDMRLRSPHTPFLTLTMQQLLMPTAGGSLPGSTLTYTRATSSALAFTPATAGTHMGPRQMTKTHTTRGDRPRAAPAEPWTCALTYNVRYNC